MQRKLIQRGKHYVHVEYSRRNDWRLNDRPNRVIVLDVGPFSQEWRNEHSAEITMLDDSTQTLARALRNSRGDKIAVLYADQATGEPTTKGPVLVSTRHVRAEWSDGMAQIEAIREEQLTIQQAKQAIADRERDERQAVDDLLKTIGARPGIDYPARWVFEDRFNRSGVDQPQRLSVTLNFLTQLLNAAIAVGVKLPGEDEVE